MTEKVSRHDSHSESNTPPETINNPRNYWKTAGCATVLAAVVGGGATLLTQPSGKKDEPPATRPPVTVTVTVEASSEATGSPEPPRPAPAGTGVRWHDHFNMTGSVDFDSLPPQDQAGGTLYFSGETAQVSGEGAAWLEAAPPTKQQCTHRLETHAAGEIPIEIGTRICYRSDKGRIAYFEVLNLYEEGISSYRFETDLTVWER